MPARERDFVPAAGSDWLLPLYDPMVKLLGGEADHRRLIEQAHIQHGQRILDIGCGTGSLAVLVKRLCPSADVVGLDPDPKALARARRKAEQGGVAVRFDRGFADELPYPDRSCDRVLSAFMFHHLGHDERERTLREIGRVLTPGGSLHVIDFAAAHEGVHGFLARLLHGRAPARDEAGAKTLALMQAAGFADVARVAQRRSLAGRIVYYRASSPE